MPNPKICGKFVEILPGFCRIDNVDAAIKSFLAFAAEQKIFLQVVSLRPVAGKNHVMFALEQTFSAFETGTNFAKSAELEFLLRLSANKQIEKALDILGLKPGKNEALAVVAGKEKKSVSAAFAFLKKSIAFKPVKGLLEKNAQKNAAEIKQIFQISSAELAALSDKKSSALEEAVIERVALLSLES